MTGNRLDGSVVTLREIRAALLALTDNPTSNPKGRT